MQNRFNSILVFTLAVCLLAPVLVDSADAAPKKGGSAFLKSLLIPGWGQYDLGDKRSALMFLSAEVLMIGGVLSMRAYGCASRDDYKALAAAHAGVAGDHGHDFYVDVGNWLSVDDFNNERMLERNYGSLYTAPEDFWLWDTDENRATMENIRIRSDRAFNTVIYFAAGMALNHLVSAIHAGRRAAMAAEDPDKSERRSSQVQFHWTPSVRRDSFGLNLNCKF